jgi:hypothetical protein
VVLLGPRQVGKTTLARSLVRADTVFLDMERPADVARVHDAETYLGTVADKLVVIDEALDGFRVGAFSGESRIVDGP